MGMVLWSIISQSIGIICVSGGRPWNMEMTQVVLILKELFREPRQDLCGHNKIWVWGQHFKVSFIVAQNSDYMQYVHPRLMRDVEMVHKA